MKKIFIYKVEFIIKKQGEHNFFVFVLAYNQKEAINYAKDLWYETHMSHMFHIKSYICSVEAKTYERDTFYRVREY